MNALGISPLEILQTEERLRQERETFDQRKEQEARWFDLRIRLGYTAAVLLPVVAAACLLILFNHERFPGLVISAAAGAFFVDVLGLVIAVWKMVLNPEAVTKLEPVTEDAAK